MTIINHFAKSQDFEAKNFISHYEATYNPKYDFLGQSYASMYPNLHKYPATMLPQIGLELLKDFNAKKTNLLDPYCGSGSSFISGLEYGIKNFTGFDLNPLALMIVKAKLSYIDTKELLKSKDDLFTNITLRQDIKNTAFKNLQNITNIDFWIPKNTWNHLAQIYYSICKIKNENIKNIFTLAFSETLREISYTRNSEFKLFRMKDFESYKPDVIAVFYRHSESVVQNYLNFYQIKVRNADYTLHNTHFNKTQQKFDTILTSPPYGDSKTTVAYGQFSTFINEWLGFKEARKLDSMLLGGKKTQNLYVKGVLKDYILEIAKIDNKRALEVSSFYFDLEKSIISLLDSINHQGKIFFIVGNRKVKNITLPSDEFIAEIFSQNGFKYLSTIKRKISNKTMPIKNSPSNKAGILSNTMNNEFIIVCEKS